MAVIRQLAIRPAANRSAPRVCNPTVTSPYGGARALAGHGVGRVLLAHLIQTAAEQELASVWLTAQLQAVDFYRRASFVVEGDRFMETGIAHWRMVRRVVD